MAVGLEDECCVQSLVSIRIATDPSPADDKTVLNCQGKPFGGLSERPLMVRKFYPGQNAALFDLSVALGLK
jgi:hypothetical protein